MSAPENKRRRLAEKSEVEVHKTLGEQIADLLQRKPKNCDVIFSVGPEQVKVEAIKVVLKAVSPVFENDFDNKWESLKLQEGEGIPLPNIDPTAFKLFVNLLILDTWSLDSIKALQLSQQNLLSLLWLCRQYEITKAITNLEAATYDFMRSFDPYTTHYLEISRENLEAIFSLEKIPLDEYEVFECACRWAGNQCTQKGLELTGENYRQVLGGCFFEIRFPTMSNEEFTEACLTKKDLLKNEEKLAVYEYIGMNADEKARYDKTRLPFRTNRRVQGDTFGYSVVSLPEQFKPTTSPPFVCDGSREKLFPFQVSEKISLHKIGFFGPIHEDTYFDVTVQIFKRDSRSTQYDSGKLTKNIFARKGKTFYFVLDEPIVIDSIPCHRSLSACHSIEFSLKGTNNIPQYKEDTLESESVQVSGVEFLLGHSCKRGNPLAELWFEKI